MTEPGPDPDDQKEPPSTGRTIGIVVLVVVGVVVLLGGTCVALLTL